MQRPCVSLTYEDEIYIVSMAVTGGARVALGTALTPHAAIENACRFAAALKHAIESIDHDAS